MISDVLSDAVCEIERYEADCPENYSDPVFREKLAFVKGIMTVLRAELDIPPGVTPYISPAGQTGLRRVTWSRVSNDGALALHSWRIEGEGAEG